MAAPTSDLPVSFDTAFEGLFRTLGPRMTPQLKDRLAALGVDPAHLKPACPAPLYLESLKLCAELGYPELPYDNACFAIGRGFPHGFAKTAVGAAVVALARVIGVKRTLGRQTRNLRTSNNYVSSTIRELGPTEVEMTTVSMPQYLPALEGVTNPTLQFSMGIALGILEILNAPNPSVTLESRLDAQRGGIYRVRWG